MIEIPQDLDQILRDWARWARVRRWTSHTCASAERMYTPPLAEIYDDEPKPLPVDARLAWKVECSWRGIPVKERMIVKATYITAPKWQSTAWEIHKRVQCRKIGIRNSEFEAFAKRGALMIYNRLRFRDIGYTIRAKQVLPLGQERVADEPPSRAAFSFASA